MGVIAAGEGGQIHLIGGKTVQRLESGTSHDLLGLVRLPSNETLAVGDFGALLVGDGDALNCFAPALTTEASASNWDAMQSGTDRQLWGIWDDPSTKTVFACGEEGTVLALNRGQ